MPSFGMFDILIAFCGVYLIYTSLKMKKTGDISDGAIVGKGVDLNSAPDPQGYIDYMYLKSVILGICTVISGGIDYANETYWHFPYVSAVICGVFFVVIIVYCKIAMDAQKKYLTP